MPHPTAAGNRLEGAGLSRVAPRVIVAAAARLPLTGLPWKTASSASGERPGRDAAAWAPRNAELLLLPSGGVAAAVEAEAAALLDGQGVARAMDQRAAQVLGEPGIARLMVMPSPSSVQS